MTIATTILRIHPTKAIRGLITNNSYLGIIASFLSLLINFVPFAQAETLVLPTLTNQSLGKSATVFVERNHPLTFEQAQTLVQEGNFQPNKNDILSFGINSKPVWLHLDIENPTESILDINVIVGVTWLDHIQLFTANNNQLNNTIISGDELPRAKNVIPALGYILPVRFPAGHSELYMRVESIDSMVIPIDLLTDNQVQLVQLRMSYTYGFIYGFLIALCIYNLLLFVGLRERSYLYYSLTLISVIIGNIAYTGHGLAWLWPAHPFFQRYIIPVQMVLYSFFGLLFAHRFLAIAKQAPKLSKFILGFCFFGLAVIGLCVATDSHKIAVYFAFIYMSAFTLLMLGLGLHNAFQGHQTGRYFMVASACGMLGAASTVFAVWGWLPFTYRTYHALEIGLILEASLFAFALAYQIRYFQRLSLQAEQLARIDPLTGLHNRRAFIDLSNPIWNAIKRQNRPVSIIMIDVDHFKRINDQYGHEAGDSVLVEISRLLAQKGRGGDVSARWGGEEFVMLLPETTLSQASTFAERLREAISAMPLPTNCGITRISASFGVAERVKHHDLEDLIRAADTQLYIAKHEGRNKVSSSLVQAI